MENNQIQVCRKCGGAMKPSKAIPNTYIASDEGTVNEVAHVGNAPLVDCMKCEACGWSVTDGVASDRVTLQHCVCGAILPKLREGETRLKCKKCGQEHDAGPAVGNGVASDSTDGSVCQPDGLMFDAFGRPRVRYVRVVYDRHTCVVTPQEAEQIKTDLIADRYKFTDVFLSKEEFDALPEFNGF